MRPPRTVLLWLYQTHDLLPRLPNQSHIPLEGRTPCFQLRFELVDQVRLIRGRQKDDFVISER